VKIGFRVVDRDLATIKPINKQSDCSRAIFGHVHNTFLAFEKIACETLLEEVGEVADELFM
jgi:hypothetical protein